MGCFKQEEDDDAYTRLSLSSVDTVKFRSSVIYA
ncbi:hypothetical protein PI124_g10368 [Phytophthora idaei]|nr:hypothetical protein PI124_g10368 [Phytophthora idaei]